MDYFKMDGGNITVENGDGMHIKSSVKTAQISNMNITCTGKSGIGVIIGDAEPASQSKPVLDATAKIIPFAAAVKTLLS